MDESKPEEPGVEIWRRRLEAVKARRDALRTWSMKYDWDIYAPTMSAIRDDCYHLTGHKPTGRYSDGRGNVWQHCAYCSARIRLES